ncbi:MAG: substrate-binding domain-containing protein [Cyanobacteria bacterium P01_G01_bin.39]
MATPGKDIVKTILITAILCSAFWYLFLKQDNVDNSNIIKPPKIEEQPKLPSTDSFREVQAPRANTVYYSSSSWLDIARIIDAKITGFHRHFQVNIKPVGSQQAKQNLINNASQVPFVVSSSPLSQSEHEQANQRGLDLRETAIALDGIAFVVNEELPLTEITVEQIKQIYTREISNWSQIIPGYNQEILAIYPDPKTRGTGRWFEKEILQQQAFEHQSCNITEQQLSNNNICFVQENTEGKRILKNNANAIYFATASQVIDECRLTSLKLSTENLDKFIAPYTVSSLEGGECINKKNRVNTSAFKSQDYPAVRYIYIIANFDRGTNQEIAEAYTKMIKTNEIQAEIDQNGKFLSIINSIE